MKKTLLTLALLPMLAFAGARLKTDTFDMHLKEAPCSHPLIVKLIAGTQFANLNWFAGTVKVEDEDLALCWAVGDEDKIIVVDEQGQGGFILKERFTKE